MMMSYKCHKTYSHNCNDAHADQQAQPLTAQEVSEWMVVARNGDGIHISCRVLLRFGATIDALRLTLEQRDKDATAMTDLLCERTEEREQARLTLERVRGELKKCTCMCPYVEAAKAAADD